MKKLENNVSTSDEDDEEDNASQNDVIDISKDCTKANPLDKVYQTDKYQFSLNPEKTMVFKQQQPPLPSTDNNNSYRVPNQMPVHLMPRNDLSIYSSPRLDSNRRHQQQFYDHTENQVYGDSNQHKMSTFQQQQPTMQQRLLTASPPDYPNNEKFMIQNLDGKPKKND